jgi:hypothetical protein
MRDHVGQQDHPCIKDKGGQVRRDQRRRIDFLRRPFFDAWRRILISLPTSILGPAYHAKAELHFALGAVAVASQFMPALSQAT